MCGVTCEIIFELDISSLEKIVFLTLAWLIDGNSICFPGITYLRRRTGLSKSTIIRCIDKLIYRKFLMKVKCFRTNGSQENNAYKIINVVPENLMHLVGGGKGRQGRIDPEIFNKKTVSNLSGGVSNGDGGEYLIETPGGVCEKPLDHLSNDQRSNLTIRSNKRDFSENETESENTNFEEPQKRTKKRTETMKNVALPRKKSKAAKKSPQELLQMEGLFTVFWDGYPRSEGKQRAFKSFCDLNPDQETFDKIMDGVKLLNLAVQNGKELKYCKMPEGYLSQKRWEDKVITNWDGKNDKSKTEPRRYSIAERIHQRQQAELHAKNGGGQIFDMGQEVFPKNV